MPPPTEAFVVAKPRRNLIVKSRHSCRLDGLCHEELPTDPKKARALLEKCGKCKPTTMQCCKDILVNQRTPVSPFSTDCR